MTARRPKPATRPAQVASIGAATSPVVPLVPLVVVPVVLALVLVVLAVVTLARRLPVFRIATDNFAVVLLRGTLDLNLHRRGRPQHVHRNPARLGPADPGRAFAINVFVPAAAVVGLVTGKIFVVVLHDHLD